MRKNKGVIRDDAVRLAALEKIENYVDANFKDAKLVGEMESPIKGGDGNVEYLIGFKKE